MSLLLKIGFGVFLILIFIAMEYFVNRWLNEQMDWDEEHEE